MNDKANILVIDDDELVLATIGTMLTRARYDVTLAANGDDGIAQLYHQHVDLVLCDIAMAEKDDLYTLRGLKALAPATPVIMMMSRPAEDRTIDRLGLDYLGATLAIGARVIEKPFLGSDLVALVYDCLAHRSTRVH